MPAARLLSLARAILAAGGLCALAACAAGPEPTPAGAGPPGQGGVATLGCTGSACCADPVSLRFAPHRLYCKAQETIGNGDVAGSASALQQAIAAGRAETVRKQDAAAVLCYALTLSAHRASDTDSARSRADFAEGLRFCRAGFGAQAPIVGQALLDSAWQLVEMGEFEPARLQLRELIQMSRQHARPAEEAEAIDRLGSLEGIAGNPAAERALLAEALAMRRKLYGPVSEAVGMSYFNMGSSFARAGEHAQARSWYERALAAYTGALGAGHANTLAAMHAYAKTYLETGDYKKAQELLEALLPQAALGYGPKDERSVRIINDIGYALEHRGRYRQALRRFEEALATRRLVAPNTLLHGMAAINAATVRQRLADCAGASELGAEARGIAARLAPSSDTDVADFKAAALALDTRCARPARPAPRKKK